jgi:hypothetical protein
MTVSIDEGGSNVIKGGPVNEAGKVVVRWNATRHGIRSPAPVVPGVEKKENWEEHRASVLESFSPFGYLELVLAERVAAKLLPLAPLARMPTPNPDIPLTYGQRAKETNRRSASMATFATGQDATCATHATHTGSN